MQKWNMCYGGICQNAPKIEIFNDRTIPYHRVCIDWTALNFSVNSQFTWNMPSYQLSPYSQWNNFVIVFIDTIKTSSPERRARFFCVSSQIIHYEKRKTSIAMVQFSKLPLTIIKRKMYCIFLIWKFNRSCHGYQRIFDYLWYFEIHAKMNTYS